jgi:hypothetical protein
MDELFASLAGLDGGLPRGMQRLTIRFDLANRDKFGTIEVLRIDLT